MTTSSKPSPDPLGTSDPGSSSRWTTVAWLAASVLLVALIVGVWLQVGRNSAGANLGAAVVAGQRPVAPALPTRGIAGDGASGMPESYGAAGSPQQVLVVNWWASWCGPCIEEAPVLRDAANEHDGAVQVVALNAGSQDLEIDARAFVREHGLDELAVVRGDRADEAAWGVNGFPMTFVVGTDGRISSMVNGPVDAETLEAMIDTELEADRS